jgi:hypothetical protein
VPAGVFVSITPELVVVLPGAISLAGALLDAPLMAGALVSVEPGADSLAGGLAEPDWFSVELFPHPARNSKAISGIIFFMSFNPFV